MLAAGAVGLVHDPDGASQAATECPGDALRGSAAEGVALADTTAHVLPPHPHRLSPIAVLIAAGTILAE